MTQMYQPNQCQHGQVMSIVIIISCSETLAEKRTPHVSAVLSEPPRTRTHGRVQTHEPLWIRRISLEPAHKKRMGGHYLLHPRARREQSQLSSPLQRQRPFSSSFFSQIATFTRRSIRSPMKRAIFPLELGHLVTNDNG